MEPEDLPWPGELEEEEGEEAAAKATNSDEVVVEEVEEEAGKLDSDFNYGYHHLESTDDDDEDEEAKAWLQAHPGGPLPPPPPPARYRYSEGERPPLGKVVPLTCYVWQQSFHQGNSGTQISDTNAPETTAQWGSGEDQRIESWHCLPQEMDSSLTLATPQTEFSATAEGTEVTDFPSVEEGVLTQSENQVKEPNRDLLCSPLLVIQDSFASPDLPLLTCPTQDQEFGSDSLFHQSELGFAPLRGIPDRSEDTEWLSRPSEVSEALFQATSEVTSDLTNSCFSVSQHTLIGSTAVGSQRSFLPSEQGNNEEAISSGTVDELKTAKVPDSYGAPCSYMSWKTRKDTQQPEINLTNKDEVSVSTSSDITDGNIDTKRSSSFDASCSYAQYWTQGVLQQGETYLTSKDHDSFSDSSDTIDKNKIPQENNNFSVPFSCVPWNNEETPHHPETCVISEDCVSFPDEVAPHHGNKTSYSFLRCLLERRGKGVPSTSDSYYFESVCLKAPAENELKQQMDSLESCEKDEGLLEELSQYFEQSETKNNLVSSEVQPGSSQMQYIGNVVVPDNSVKVSEAHILSRGQDNSKMEPSAGPLQTVKSHLDETSEQLYFQEEEKQKATSVFGEKNVDATENIAFEAVIASIEPSKKEGTVNEIQTDINKSLTDDSQEREPKNSDLSPLNYNDENSFFDKLKHPRHQSTPGVFEPETSKPLLHKEDDDDSSLYQHPNLKSPPNAPQEMFIKPPPVIPELKSSASLSEKSYNQAVGLDKTQSALFQYDINSEPFLPIGKIKSIFALDLAEKVGSSDINYYTKVSTSDSLVLQDLKQPTFEEVADSSNYNLEGLPGKTESDIITPDAAAERSSLYENAVVCGERIAELQRKADRSHLGVNQPFSLMPSFVPHEPTRGSAYHSSTLRMLRVSPDAPPKTLQHLTGDTAKGGIAEITQSNLKSGITTTTGDLDTGSHLSLSLGDLSQSAVSSPQDNANGQHTDTLNQKTLTDTHLTEETLKDSAIPEPTDQKTRTPTVSSTSYSHRGKPNIFYQQDLPDSHLTEEALKVLGVPGPADQKTGIPTITSASHSHRGKPIAFYQQALQGSQIPEEALKVSAVSGPADQKSWTVPVLSTSYSHRERPSTFYQQELPDVKQSEEALKVLAALGPADYKTAIPTVPSSSYSQREKPIIFYQQALPDSHLTEEALKVSAVAGLADQKTRISTVTSTSYSQREKLSVSYQQTLPDSHLTEEALKVSVFPGPGNQKTELTSEPSSFYSHREKPIIFSQQTLPDSHLPEEALKVSAVSGSADQKARKPTVSSRSYSHGEKSSIFYQQELPDSHSTEKALKVSIVPIPGDQKTGIQTITPISYSQSGKAGILYHPTLPDSHLPKEAAPGPAFQTTGIPTVTSTSYSQREKPGIFYQQTLLDSHLLEKDQKVSAAPGPADHTTGIPPTVTSTSYLDRERSGIFYQQTLASSHIPEEALRVSAALGPAFQTTGIPTVTSISYSQREKPGIFYQQTLLDSHLLEKDQKVSAAPGPTDHTTGIPPTITSTSYSDREKSGIFYQQTLAGSHIPEEALRVSFTPGPADQTTGIATVTSTSKSQHREKPGVFYQQDLPGSHLTEEAQKVSVVSGPADQTTGIPAVTSPSYSHREKPGIFYQPALAGSYIPEEALRVSFVPSPADQKTGRPTVTSTSNSYREKPIIFYQEAFPDRHLPEEAQKVSPALGSADQKTDIPTATSTSYSHREKPIIFYQQTLSDSGLTEAQKVSLVSPADQKTGTPTVTSTSYSHREKLGTLYQQGLAGSHIPEETQKVSVISGLADQKTGVLTVTSTSYPHREKPGIFHQEVLPGSHLTEEALKVSPTPESTDQKTGTPTVSSTSYSHREKPIIFYQQVLPDSHLTEEALKVSVVSGPADQKTGISTVSPVSYTLGEKPIIFYQQALSDGQLTKEALKVLGVAGPVDQKTGIPTVTYSSYSHREKPIISYQQELSDSHLTKKALKVSNVPELADQKTGIPTVTSTPYSYREKPSVPYQQDLPEFDEETLILLGIASGADQRNVIRIVPSSSYSHSEKPIISYQQELPNYTEEGLKVLVVPGTADQETGIQIVPSTSYSQGERSIISYQQELPDLTEVALKAFGVSGPADQKTEIQRASSSSYSHGEKSSVYPQQEFPDSHLADEALKVSAVFVPAEQDTGIPTGIPNYYSHKEKLKISTVDVLDYQKTELPATTPGSYSHGEKPRISTVIGPDDQKTPLLTVFRSSYSQGVKPATLLQQQLPDGDQSEDTLKISAVPEPTDVNTGKPVPLSGSYFHREKPNIFYPQELPDTHLTEDTLKLSTVHGPADQKTVLPVASPSSFSLREKSNIFYQKDLPDRHVTEDALKFSGGPGQADQITGLQTVPSSTYSDGEKHKLVSKHIQREINNLNSSDSSVSSNNMPLNSQADDKVVINKPESSGLVDVGSEEIRDAESSSKTLKEIQTLLMEAENIALKRCNFPAPLVPFRDVGDISFIQSKKVVCFREPSVTDVCDGDLLQRQPCTEERPSNRCMQKDIGTQTNLKCQRGIENWEFISSTTVRSPLQEAESKASMALEETLRKYEAAKSVMRSEPEGYTGTIGNKIIIPMMTIIKSDSSSDISDGNGSCSWDSNLPESLESVSDVLLNFFPYVTPKTSITDSREEEGMSESEDGGGSSVDSLAAHVKNLLKCESSLNHAKQILRNAEEEECRVRARAWNMKFNLAHDYGYSISKLNEDDRRKVEEIKAELFGHGRTTDLSKGLQSPRGIGCKPEAVCSHIIIESHEKGCFRTLTAAEEPQLDSHTCVFRSSDPSEMIRGRRSPSSWKAGHIDLSTSLDQNNPRLKVWNSLQLQSHSPFQDFVSDDFKISKGVRMPFHEKMNPWLSELVEPAFVPPKEVDFHSSSQMPPPEPTKKFTTSITFSSHRHSKCISDSSVLKVGVSEGSQCTGASVGVFNSHFTEEQNPPRDLNQKTSSPSSFKIRSHSPDKDVSILAEGSRKSQKLPVDFEHSHKEEKLLERSGFKGSHSEPSARANCSNFKEVQFSGNHTLISMGRPSSTLGVRQKNVTITPDIPSSIFLEQRELFEQSRAPHADHHVRKHHSPPPQHQDYVAPILPSCVLLEQRELFEQTKAPHIDHQMRENHFPFPQGQDYIASDLPSPIFLEQRQSKAPGIDDHMKKHRFPLPQGQDSVVEKNNQHKPKSHTSNMINVEAKFSNVSQSAPNHCTLETSASTPSSNRKALSCVRITLCPKTPSKLDSGTLDKRFHSLDAASKTRMNSEFNFDLQTISSRSLEPTSKLLTSKPVAQDQESLGFLGRKSSLDFQVVQSSLPDSNTVTQDLKTVPSQNRQIVTSRQIQVNISDLEGYSNPEGTPISADRSSQKVKTSSSAFPEKLSSDAVTQITTESPEKTMFSSEIFINAEDRGHEIPESSSQKLNKAPVKFASSSSVQHIAFPRGTDGQPLLLPYKPSGSTKMYYVPQLGQIPSSLDSKSDTTVESSHSGSNDAIAPNFPAQVLGTRDDDLSATVNIKHKEGIYSKRAMSKAFLPVGKKPLQKDNADASVQVPITGDENLSDKKQKEEIISTRAVTNVAEPEEKESLQKDTADSSGVTAAEHSAQVQDTEIKNLPDTKALKQKEKIHSKTTVPMEAWPKDEESLQIDIEESECRSEFENTTHSVFRSAKFYIHHPVHLPSDQDFGHESLGRSVFMRHSWKDFFQHHQGKQREHTFLLPSSQNVDKTETDYARIKSLSINVNLGNKEVVHTPKSQGRDHPQHNRQISDPKRDHKVTPELTTPHTVSLNELWNKYQERQRQQKPPEFRDRKELSLVERLDRLAKLLQNPITHSLQASESTHDDSRGEQGAKEWSSRQQQRNKLLKKKRYKSLEKSRKNTGDLKKSKVLSTHQAGRSNQIKIEQIKFDKYILRKQPSFNYISNTSSDSRPSEESELLTDPTNILSTTSVESDILTQTDGEVAVHERSSSISTIDTARLIQAFGHDRVCLSPRQIKLYSSITNQQRRYLEKRSKYNRKALNTGHPLMTSEHTRRRHIQVANHMISSDSIPSSAHSLSSNSTICNEQNVHMLNKGVQAGNLEIVNGPKKHTRDVGMTFPTPSSSEARLEEDSDVTSWSEEKIEEKILFTSFPEDKKLKKNNQTSCEGVSWFVPVENVKSGSKKENLPKIFGPGISWFEPMTKTKPWREPLREQNWQGQRTDCRESPAGAGRDDGREPLKPFVRTTLQESLQLHRPDFISRSGERIKRLKLIVQERKLQNILQSERDTLFNTGREWQGCRNPMHLLPKRVFLAAQKNRPIGKKEMIQRSKRIYEQLPEVRKKREEEKRRSEYKSYRLRAQLYKKKVTNQLLGRKVPWE